MVIMIHETVQQPLSSVFLCIFIIVLFQLTGVQEVSRKNYKHDFPVLSLLQVHHKVKQAMTTFTSLKVPFEHPNGLRFDIYTVLTVRILIFWDVTLCTR